MFQNNSLAYEQKQAVFKHQIRPISVRREEIYKLLDSILSSSSLEFPESVVQILADLSLCIGGFHDKIPDVSRYVSYPHRDFDEFQQNRTITYNRNAPDYRQVPTNFSFTMPIKASFDVIRKGDEMWIGVVENVSLLTDSYWFRKRGGPGYWSYYCGRERGWIPPESYPRLDNGPPRMNKIMRDSGHGTLHFPSNVRHVLQPVRSADRLTIHVNPKEGIFEAWVNGKHMVRETVTPWEQPLIFWVELDATDDEVRLTDVELV